MNENSAMAGRAGAAGLAKKPYKKYWIAGDDYEYGHAIDDDVWNNLKTLKPDVQLLGEFKLQVHHLIDAGALHEVSGSLSTFLVYN